MEQLWLSCGTREHKHHCGGETCTNGKAANTLFKKKEHREKVVGGGGTVEGLRGVLWRKSTVFHVFFVG